MSAMLHRLFLALCLLVAASSSAQAEVILDNLTGATEGGNTGLHSILRKAVSFVMGPQDYTLDSVALRLNYLDGTPVVELRSDGVGEPGALITQFDVPAEIGNDQFQTYNFTPLSSVLLSAGTKYWLEVYGATADPIQWRRPFGDTEPAPTAAASFTGAMLFSGGVWNDNAQVNMFRLEAYSAVPEPTSFLLVAGLAAAGGLRRRLRRR